jgi:hypothetical protein
MAATRTHDQIIFGGAADGDITGDARDPDSGVFDAVA